MKKLFIIRHAKSSWDDPDLPDHERPLNHRGEKDAPRMAKRLKEKNVHPDQMISSTAVRALHTCVSMADILKFPKNKIETNRKIYHASEEQLLEVVRSIKDFNDREEVVLLFGHNPGLTEFVNLLADQNIMNIPTTGVVAIEFQVEKWKEVEYGNGKLIFFDFPKSKD